MLLDGCEGQQDSQQVRLYMTGNIRNLLKEDNMETSPNIADTHRIFLRMSRKKKTLSKRREDIQASYKKTKTDNKTNGLTSMIMMEQ
ncbi:hypothetical protein C922_05848 [Plasmodium inui San Antonio 1]|uniref:Uncharacterized protein n=1 Tax=Plasmodium inui San Antonio 1 TaxID=1237626 RepID=W6ZWV7_9APIC|nr:hypothetical protein C922_05848 [Plasmodium inui San Antonio 1]EUD63065.1 hypothetical protein C922_05848 [Plasmodium inui San Antonio 1]